MHTTFIFVHGTGVRRQAYEESLAQITCGLHEHCPETTAVGCLWGDEFGASLAANGASIPGNAKTKGFSESYPGRNDGEREIWNTLYEDPLDELRQFGMHSAHASHAFSPGQLDPTVRLRTQVRLLAEHTEIGVSASLEEAGVPPDDLNFAIDQLTIEPQGRLVFNSAVQCSNDEDSELIFITARCIVAFIARLHLEEEAISESVFGVPSRIVSNAKLRDGLVIRIAEQLHSTKKKSVLGNWAKSISAKYATRHIRTRRSRYSRALIPFVGDILAYQAHGGAIRDKIASTVFETKLHNPHGKIILLGHSLGGIACVDLLALDQRCRCAVAALITVGSQAPLFFELNALKSCPGGQRLPSDFPAWLNVYDLCDFLSYVAEGVFPEVRVLKDQPVVNGCPFPESHSAYWANAETWKSVRDFLTSAL